MASFSIPNIPSHGYIPAIKQISGTDSIYRLTDAPTIDAAKSLGFEEYRVNAPWAGNTAILSQKISDKVASLPSELVGDAVTATIRSAEVLSDVSNDKITASGVLSAISSGNAIGYIANAIGYNIGKKSAEEVNDFWEDVQKKVFGKRGKLLQNADAPVIIKHGKPYVNERLISAVRNAFFELGAGNVTYRPATPIESELKTIPYNINSWGGILLTFDDVKTFFTGYEWNNEEDARSRYEKWMSDVSSGANGLYSYYTYQYGTDYSTPALVIYAYGKMNDLLTLPATITMHRATRTDVNGYLYMNRLAGLRSQYVQFTLNKERKVEHLVVDAPWTCDLYVGQYAYDFIDYDRHQIYVGSIDGTAVGAIPTIAPTSGIGYKDQTIADAFPDWRAKALGFPANVGSEEKEYWYPLTIPEAIPAISGLDDTQEKAWAGELTDTITPTKEEVLDNVGVISIPKVDVTPIPTPNPEPPLIPTPPAVSDISADIGLCSLYNPSLSQVKEFSRWLWGTDFNIDQFKKLFQDPMQAIIGLHVIYATPVTGAQSGIQVGYINSGVNAAVVTKQYAEIDCGTIALNESFGDLRDYSPYTQVSLYLPFVGIVEINTDDVMRASISIKYKIDVLTGTCLALVKVKRNDVDGVLYSYSGNCGVQYPITAGSYLGTIGSLISMVATGAATYASGGALAPLAIGAAANALSGGAKANTSMSGSLSSNAGAMGIRKPYLIIKRVEPAEADRYSEYYGYTTNKLVKLSQVSGYVRIKDINLSGTNATEDEQNEIVRLLKEGVIL